MNCSASTADVVMSAHPEMVRPTIPRSGRRRRSVRCKRGSVRHIVPTVEEILDEAKQYTRGWFAKRHEDKEGDLLEKKIQPLNQIPASFKKFVKGPIRIFGKKSSDASEHIVELLSQIKSDMYFCSGKPNYGDSMREQGNAMTILANVFTNADRTEKEFANNAARLIESFCRSCAKNSEILEKLHDARAAFAHKYQSCRVEYEEALAGAVKKREKKKGWFGKNSANSTEFKHPPEKDENVVAAHTEMRAAEKKLGVVTQVLKDKLAEQWIEREKLLVFTLRKLAEAETQRCRATIEACDKAVATLSTDGCIEHFYNPGRYGAFANGTSNAAAKKLPTLVTKVRKQESFAMSKSMVKKLRVPTPKVQFDQHVEQLIAMGFPKRFSQRALKESKGDMEAAVTLLLANKKVGKMFGITSGRNSSADMSTSSVSIGVSRPRKISPLPPPPPPVRSRARTASSGQGACGSSAAAVVEVDPSALASEAASKVLRKRFASDSDGTSAKLMRRLSELTKGKRRGSTYTKVRDALVEEFGKDAFAANKTQVQEYLRTGGKGAPPSVPASSSASKEASKTEDDDNNAAVTCVSIDSKRLGVILRSDGIVLWRRASSRPLKNVQRGDRFVRIGETDISEGTNVRDVIAAHSERPIQIHVKGTDEAVGADPCPGVAPLVVESVAYIKAHGMKVDGIFRKNGNLGTCTELRKAFLVAGAGQSEAMPDLESALEPDEGNVRTVASLMKMYFRLAENPLIPEHAYETVVACGSDAEALQKVLNDRALIPPANYETMASLMPFLRDVTGHSDDNRMTAKALSICWAQSLMRTPVDENADASEVMMKIAMDTAKCNAVVEALIENADTIFETRLAFDWV